MTKVVFETATFADAIKKADRVAPNKGSAFDKAAGIVIRVNPENDPPVTVEATDLDVYYREWVDAVSVEGAPADWRIPSTLIATMVASLPIGTGKEIILEEVTKGNHTHLQVRSGKTKARFNLMMVEYYPEWEVFDPDDLISVPDLGGRISMVEWAADKSTIPFSGIYFNGSSIIATDKYRLVRTPLTVPNVPENDVIVPAGLLGAVLKQTGEVRVGFTPFQVLLMPNETTQIRVVRFDTKYPNVEKLMDTTRPEKVEVNKNQLLEVMRRATAFAGADRMPTIRMFFGKEEIAVMMENADVGHIGDILDVPGQCTHDRAEMRFTPKLLMEAIEKAPGERIGFHYDPSSAGKIVYLTGDSGYEAWVVTRRD